MNMVMAGDGHTNIFNINSLEYPKGALPDVSKVAEAVNESIAKSKDKDFPFGTSTDNAQGKFDMIFTNPPFGSKVEVDPAIAAKYELQSNAPEVLFIECAYNFLEARWQTCHRTPRRHSRQSEYRECSALDLAAFQGF